MGEYPALDDQDIARIALQKALAEPPPVHQIVTIDQLLAG